jgi:hypothetical protein
MLSAHAKKLGRDTKIDCLGFPNALTIEKSS